MSQPIKVAVIGGGCAAVTAACELTRPELRGRYAVTLYQMGWRLGGKGASGRGAADRIEEHGLHLWMGYYENAFRLMRDCYAELGRDPDRVRIAEWTDAFKPASFNAVTDWSPSGAWLTWKVMFPETPGLPGDPEARPLRIDEYLVRAATLVRTLLQTIRVGPQERDRVSFHTADPSTAPPTPDALSAVLVQLMKHGVLTGLGACIEIVGLLEAALRTISAYPQSLLARVLDAVSATLHREVAQIIGRDDEARRLWEVADLVLAAIRGSIRFRLVLDPRGFDAIDDFDCREWLRLNGASEAAINSAFIRGLYDLAFAYEAGDPKRPRIAAGSALRAAFRAFFTYRGAFFWRMTTGMGDAVFAPIYEVLARRGVRFEFFHRLRNVELADAALDSETSHVSALYFDVQAALVGDEYSPLCDVRGLPCWPARPDFAQLEDGARIEAEGWDFESQWETRIAGTTKLEVGRDFDLVVLGVGLGVIPYVCGDILRRDVRWRAMIEHVQSVPTQAFQLWLDAATSELGWNDGPVNVSGFVEPFDTWADMSHLIDEETWATPPRAIAYFCSVLPDTPTPAEGPTDGAAFLDEQHRCVRTHAIDFLARNIVHLWPRFSWDALRANAPDPLDPTTRFDEQYWTANVRPSDRYSQSLPGSTPYRISPLDHTYDNLTVAGDWTQCSLNLGCVEAAVMSGMLAAHAIAERPLLSRIVGYDHP